MKRFFDLISSHYAKKISGNHYASHQKLVKWLESEDMIHVIIEKNGDKGDKKRATFPIKELPNKRLVHLYKAKMQEILLKMEDV